MLGESIGKSTARASAAKPSALRRRTRCWAIAGPPAALAAKCTYTRAAVVAGAAGEPLLSSTRALTAASINRSISSAAFGAALATLDQGAGLGGGGSGRAPVAGGACDCAGRAVGSVALATGPAGGDAVGAGGRGARPRSQPASRAPTPKPTR